LDNDALTPIITKAPAKMVCTLDGNAKQLICIWLALAKQLICIWFA
jgi:hypothetical protein